MRRFTLALIFTALIFGCSDDDSNGTKQDKAVVEKDGGIPTCGKDIYPCSPYDTKVGSVAKNLEFKGFMDPKNFCTAHKDKKTSTDKLVPISFKSYHLGDSTCAANKPTLLWVMVSAGWCSPCKTEVQEVQKEYGAGTMDPKVGVMNVVYETTSAGTAVTEKFIKTWADNFKLTLPVVMDPDFKMGAYFSRANAPYNMLIDTSSMKIYYQQQGGKLADIKKKVDEFLKK